MLRCRSKRDKKISKRKNALQAEQEIESKIKNLINSEQLSVTSDLKKAVSHSDIVDYNCCLQKLTTRKKLTIQKWLTRLKQVGAALHSGMLVIYGEVAGLGFIEGIMKETLENTSGLKAGQDFGLAYIPVHNAQIKQFIEPIARFRVKDCCDVTRPSQDAAIEHC